MNQRGADGKPNDTNGPAGSALTRTQLASDSSFDKAPKYHPHRNY
jgi:hypothetical protein